MGMKAKVGLLALLIATVAGAIAFDKFRAKTASTTDQVEPSKPAAPTPPNVAATPKDGGGLTPVREIVAKPPKPKPEPPKPKPAPPAPPVAKPEPPLPTDFTKAEPPKPMAPWKPETSNPVETVKETTPKSEAPKPTPPAPPVEIVNRPEKPKVAAPSGLAPTDVIRPPEDTKPAVPTVPAVPTAPAPTAPTPSAPVAPIAPETYEVAPGDSLYVISKKVYGSGVHYKEILAANRDKLPSEDSVLQVGMKLKIPKIAAAVPAPEAAPPTPAPELAGKRTHKVQPGDSFSTISKLYYKESRFWQKIAEANPKKDPHNLKVGDVLIIPEIETVPASAASAPAVAKAPAAPEPGGKKIHVVAQGESLSSISQKHFGSAKHWKAIFEANRGVLPTPDDLSVGMRLILPEIAAPPAPNGATATAPKTPSVPAEISALGTPYTIKEGDTLASIAEEFLGSQNEWGRIDALNKGITYKDANHLSVGMVIVIPKRADRPAPSPSRAPEVEKPAPKAEPPALQKVPTPPDTAKKGPEPPKKDGGGSTGSNLGIE